MELFNVGIGEIFVIFIIALLVFGPERLPEVAREAARVVGQLRRMADEVQRSLAEETRPLKEPFDESRRELESVAKPFGETKRELEGLARPLSEPTPSSNGAPNGETLPPVTVTPAPDAPAEQGARAYKPVSRSEGAE